MNARSIMEGAITFVETQLVVLIAAAKKALSYWQMKSLVKVSAGRSNKSTNIGNGFGHLNDNEMLVQLLQV